MICAVERIHILVLVFVFLYILLSTQEITSTKSKIKYTFICLLCAFTMYGLSTYKFQNEPEYLSPIGLNIYLGHSKPDNWNLHINGIRNNIIGHREDAKTIAEKETKKELSNVEVTQFWLSKTWQFISTNPSQYLKAQTQKLLFLFSLDPYLSQESYFYWRNKKTPLSITFIDFSIIFPLFLIGSIFLIKRNRPLKSQLSFSILSAFIYLFSLMATIVIERYRLAALLFMMPVASYTVVQLFEKKLKLPYVISIVFLYICTNVSGSIINNKTNDWLNKKEATEMRLRSKQESWFKLRARLDNDPLTVESCREVQQEIMNIKFHRDLKALVNTCSKL